MAMLDLKQFQQKILEVGILDGTTLKLKKPSQKMVISMIALDETLKESTDPVEQLDAYVTVLQEILNNNVGGRKFTREEIETEYDLEIGQVLIDAYLEFVNKLNSQKN